MGNIIDNFFKYVCHVTFIANQQSDSIDQINKWKYQSSGQLKYQSSGQSDLMKLSSVVRLDLISDDSLRDAGK